jgi:hypothetical protein
MLTRSSFFGSGSITINSGDVDDAFDSGKVILRTGTSSLKSGDIELAIGEGAISPGSVSLSGGKSKRGGDVSVYAGDGYSGDGGTVSLLSGNTISTIVSGGSLQFGTSESFKSGKIDVNSGDSS